MTIAVLIALLVQYLPTIVEDIASVAATLALASNAVSKAQTTGVVSDADWAALDQVTNGALATLHTAAQATA
jgi:hypothetical protein